jgi:hypothetical protein
MGSKKRAFATKPDINSPAVFHLLLRVYVIAALVGIVCPLLMASPAHAAAGTNFLGPNEVLYIDQSITSTDERFTLLMQSDGNLVLYQNGVAALWSTNTVGSGADRVIMQSDGNLVLYTPNSGAVWSSGTVGESSDLIIQDDGNLVIYRERDGAPTWSTNTSPLDDPRRNCLPDSNEVSLFIAANYQLVCHDFGPGSYADIRTANLPNDTISSVRVGANAAVELCSDVNFEGVCEVFFGDDPDLTGNRIGNNQTSSLRVKVLQRLFLPLMPKPEQSDTVLSR